MLKTNETINEMVAKLNEWEALADELKNEIESLKDELKAELLARDTEELNTDKYIIRWTSITSNRFDSTAFKKEYAELYKEYTKQVASKRFTISK